MPEYLYNYLASVTKILLVLDAFITEMLDTKIISVLFIFGSQKYAWVLFSA